MSDRRRPRARSPTFKRRALASDQLNGPITVDINRAGTVASIAVPVDGSGSDSASNASLAVLRDDIVPATVGTIPGAEVGVSGFTAESKDFSDKIKAVAPLVFGFVLVFAFGLLLFAFRSLVLAAKAIVLNLLSVAAAYGVMVLVFQHGVGQGLLGFDSTAGIDSFLPIFIFVILFGLSMDYHVFILSRIREAYDRGMSTERGGQSWDQDHGRRRHERGDRDGLRLLGIRDAPDADLQTVRRRPCSGDPDRRHGRPGRTPARDDEGPRRLELVPAQVARVAAAPRARRLDRASSPAPPAKRVAGPWHQRTLIGETCRRQHPLPAARARGSSFTRMRWPPSASL